MMMLIPTHGCRRCRGLCVVAAAPHALIGPGACGPGAPARANTRPTPATVTRSTAVTRSTSVTSSSHRDRGVGAALSLIIAGPTATASLVVTRGVKQTRALHRKGIQVRLVVKKHSPFEE